MFFTHYNKLMVFCFYFWDLVTLFIFHLPVGGYLHVPKGNFRNKQTFSFKKKKYFLVRTKFSRAPSGPRNIFYFTHIHRYTSRVTYYTLSGGVNWADLMAALGVFGTDFYDRSTRTIVGTMLWTEYRPVI